MQQEKKDYFGLPIEPKGFNRRFALDFCTKLMELSDAYFTIELVERGEQIRNYLRYLSKDEQSELLTRINDIYRYLAFALDQEKVDIIKDIVVCQRMRIKQYFKQL